MSVLLLQHAIKVAAARHAEHAAAVAAAVAAAALKPLLLPPPQQRGLRLRELLCAAPSTSTLLHGLLAHSLTQLQLDCATVLVEAPTADGCSVNTCSPVAALARLSSLQVLGLYSTGNACGSWLLAVTQLTQLKNFKVEGRWQGIGPPLQQLLSQPLLLQKLYLNVQLRVREQLPLLDLQQLTQLTMLSADRCALRVGTMLPTQLQHLRLDSGSDGDALSAMLLPLQQLRRLRLTIHLLAPEQLLRLTQLSALQHLTFMYDSANIAAATAAAWRRLPRLHSLVIHPCSRPGNGLTRAKLPAILAGLAAATSLTSLSVRAGSQGENVDVRDLAVCTSLAGLKNLRSLCFKGHMLSPPDTLALQAFTGLTRLQL
jgi:hypothetical protein